MKGYRIIAVVLVGLLHSCTSTPHIETDFLVGNWSVADISAEKVTIFGEPFNTEMKGQQTFKFTTEELFMSLNTTHGNSEDTTTYQFSPKDSTLTLVDNGKTERIRLNISNQNEFEIEDNMGVILKLIRDK